MKVERRHYTPQKKVSLLRRHLIEKVPVASLGEVHQLQPTVLYHWLKQFLKNGPAPPTGCWMVKKRKPPKSSVRERAARASRLNR